MPDYPRAFLRQTWVRRVLPIIMVAATVVVGTVVTRANANANPNDTYRTTTVTTGTVQQRLNVTGSVQRVNQVSESFAVAGTLASVSVAVGDTVTAGQRLAKLDPAPLRSAVTVARASLAKAKATLESDQTATTAAPAATSSQTSAQARPATLTISSTTTPATAPRVASSSGRSTSSANQRLAGAQARVTSAQKTFAADLGHATLALARCAPFLPTQAASNPAHNDSRTSTPTTAPETTVPPSASGASAGGLPAATDPTAPPSATGPSGAAIKACLGALQDVPAQRQIQRDRQVLTRAQAALTKTFSVLITTIGATTSSTSNRTGSTSQSGTSQSATKQSATNQSATNQSATKATSSSSGAQTGATGQSSAARVVSDQAAVANAEAALSSRTQDEASATLSSSTTGTVGSVGFVKGTSSTGKSIVIVGAGAVDVTANVPLASMASVHVGQKATVTPQGATTSVPGTVTSISLLPAATATGTGTSQASATTSSPTYPIVVRVPVALPALASGSRGDVSVLIGTANNVLTVPNSALTSLGSGQALALTFKNGVTTRALVKTGYVGTLTTQVTSGLVAGQKVVLADLSTALPTNTTSSRRFGVGAGAAGGASGTGLGRAGGGGSGFAPRG